MLDAPPAPMGCAPQRAGLSPLNSAESMQPGVNGSRPPRSLMK
jgi:hypothetical protein